MLFRPLCPAPGRMGQATWRGHGVGLCACWPLSGGVTGVPTSPGTSEPACLGKWRPPTFPVGVWHQQLLAGSVVPFIQVDLRDRPLQTTAPFSGKARAGFVFQLVYLALRPF